MGRKDSNKSSRTSRKRDNDSWGDGWEEMCQPSALPPATVALHAGLLPIIPPGTELEMSADALPTEAEVHVLREDGLSATMISTANFLSAAECAAWIAWGEAAPFQLEKHAQTAHIAHRDNGRLAVLSADVADALLERLRPWAPTQLGRRKLVACNPNVRLYKYGPGQRFGRHVDQSNRLADGSLTEFTLLVYLNDAGLEGGETCFYAGGGAAAVELLRVAPRAGASLVHAHGARCLKHEGAAVTRGVKYLLRSDLAYS